MALGHTHGAWVVAAVGLVVGTACDRGSPPQAPLPPEVSVVVMQPATVAEPFVFPGEVVPFRRVEVRARVNGILEERSFTEGTVVRAGQVLYRIDRVRYEAAYQGALGRVDNARSTLARLEPLLARHAVAQQDVDNARAEMAQAQAALEVAKKDLDDTVVRAEMGGRVGRTLLDVGARVTGSDDILTTIDRLDPVFVTFRPSSDQLLAWRQDSSARALIQAGSHLMVQIVLPDGSTLPRTGRLDFVAPSLDPATGTQEFRARFGNGDRLLTPGQYVRVQLVGFVRTHAMAVPQRAVQQALGRQFVLVVGPGDTVAARDVEPGPWSGPLWIIDRGLNPGDRVVVDGTQKAIPGRTVRPAATPDSATAVGTSL